MWYDNSNGQFQLFNIAAGWNIDDILDMIC